MIMRNSWSHVPPEDHQPCPRDNTSRYVLAQVSRWRRTDEPIHPETAMEIAAWYHSPSYRDQAITAFSHSGTVMIDDLVPNIRAQKIYCDHCGQEGCPGIPVSQRAALSALLSYADTVVHEATRYRRHIWHGGGHRWMSSGSDDPDQESCLTCGGEWVLRPDSADGDYGSYFGRLGPDGKPELANQCTGRTDLIHGHERHCEASNGNECEAARETGACGHTDHECNCLLCN